jgi:NAD(P)-dependent dehydrogenase (short-subunit alcohol dehydrogenase family)
LSSRTLAQPEGNRVHRLEGKVAVITGAASGIGQIAAERFASEGARVVVADIDSAGADVTVSKTRDLGGEAIFIHTDVTDEDSVAALMEKTITRFGCLDICYSNAGGSSPNDGPVTEVSVDEWWRVHRVDLFGTFLVCRNAIAVMRGRGGSIITTGSIGGLVGMNQSAYAAAKGGVLALTRAMAGAYRDEGIRVNAVVPGSVRTERVVNMVRAKGEEKAKALDSGRFREPDDVVSAALFLASDDSQGMTGAMVVVDGGLTSTIAQPVL